MSKSESLWISHSQGHYQMGLAIGSFLIGILLSWGGRHFTTWDSNEGYAFMLGWLLMTMGVGSFLSGDQTVTINPVTRTIQISNIFLWGTTTRLIAFDAVARLSIGYLGKASNGVKFYYVDAHLRHGEHVSLFAPGRFYEGSTSRLTVESWRNRLNSMLDSPLP